MRIIRGSHKGRIIHVQKSFSSRPTTDFAKENLFNVIENNFILEQKKVLDLFSGTGSISFEFASRGCKEVYAIDKDFRCIKNIKNVIEKINIKGIKVIQANVFKYIKHCHDSFDLIFADPPYDLKDISIIPELIFANNLLNNEGWFILEHSKNYDFSNSPFFNQLRKYGSVHFSIFEFTG